MLTISEIVALFKGNARSKHIQTADLRKSFSSMKPPWGSISLASTAPTDIAEVGTYVKAEGLTQENNAGYLTTNSDNRITYVGDSTRHFHIAVTVSMTCTAGSQTVGLGIALNDTVDTGTITRRFIGTGGGTDIGSTALHGDFMMSNGDYIELWVTNETNAANDVTIENLYMFMVGMQV